MSFMLVVWIYGVTVAVIPVQFPDLARCEAAGDSFKLQAERQRAAMGGRTPGYACIPVDLSQD